jgi:hypothetical protein
MAELEKPTSVQSRRCPLSGRISDGWPAAGQSNILTLQHHMVCVWASFLLHPRECPLARFCSVSPAWSSRGARNGSFCRKMSAMLGRVHGILGWLAMVARSAFRSGSRGGIVMSGATDMSSPVTQGELRTELAQLEIRFDQKLEHWGGTLLARIESGEQRMLARIESGEQRMLKCMFEHMDSSEQRLLTELARHAKAIQEAMSAQIAVIDEKYADLPARVSWLETKVSGPRRR